MFFFFFSLKYTIMEEIRSLASAALFLLVSFEYNQPVSGGPFLFGPFHILSSF